MPTLRRASGLICSLASFAGILALYQTLIWVRVLPSTDGLTQWENNRVRAESYAFGTDDRSPVVLVGSSLINNIYANRQTDWTNLINLAMAGGASQTGLEVLLRTAGPPGVVVVELSMMINRGMDQDVVDGIFGYGLFEVRKKFSMLQTRYCPAGVALRIRERSWRVLRRKNPTATQPVEKPLEKPEMNQLSADQQLIRLRFVERVYSDKMRPLSAGQEFAIRAESNVIRRQIASLEQAGWRVVLCDIPIDSRLIATTQELRVRGMVCDLFPADRYRWVPEQPDRDWATLDGIHLVSADAKVYAAFLRQYVDGLAGKTIP